MDDTSHAALMRLYPDDIAASHLLRIVLGCRPACSPSIVFAPGSPLCCASLCEIRLVCERTEDDRDSECSWGEEGVFGISQQYGDIAVSVRVVVSSWVNTVMSASRPSRGSRKRPGES